MAVYNDYVDSNIRNGRPTSAIAAQGSRTVSGRVVFNTANGDSAGSIYRVLKGIPCTAVFQKLDIYTNGVTGMSDVDVCLYKNQAGGAEVGTEVLASTLDLSSAVTAASPKNGLGNVTNANRAKMLWELAGQSISNRQAFYDVGLRSVGAITEADTVVVDYAYWAP